MMKKLLHLTGFALMTTLFFAACSEDGDDDPATTTPTTNPPVTATPPDTYPQESDADGALIAVNTVSFQDNPFLPEPLEITVGTAVAVFPTSTGDFASLQDAGTIGCNSEDLSKQQNNSYIYQPGLQNQEGIDFSGGTTSWSIGGAGSVPTFTAQYNVWPDLPQITSEKEIDRSQGYLFTLKSTIANADSVMMNIYAGSGVIQKTFGPNTRSYTFTSQELSVLDATNIGYLQAVAWTMTHTDQGGKKYYMVNETVTTEQVQVK